MATDRQLSRHFWLHEFPGWEQATEEEVERLRSTVIEPILQPTRDRWGVIWPSSWTHWRSGRRRTGAHADGGAVDFVPRDAPIPVVHAWMAANLRDRIGELIDERDHIHVTRWGLGGRGQVLVEPTEGEYEAATAASRLRPPLDSSGAPRGAGILSGGGGALVAGGVLAVVLATLSRRGN